MSIVLVFHFSLIFLANLPPNYITSKFENEISAYNESIFFQDWHLFAPTPVSHDEFLLAKAVFENGEESSWVNISKTLMTEMQKNRLSEKYVEQIMTANAVLRVGNNPDDEEAKDLIINYSTYFMKEEYDETITEIELKIDRGVFVDFYEYHFEKNKEEEMNWYSVYETSFSIKE